MTLERAARVSNGRSRGGDVQGREVSRGEDDGEDTEAGAGRERETATVGDNGGDGDLETREGIEEGGVVRETDLVGDGEALSSEGGGAVRLDDRDGSVAVVVRDGDGVVEGRRLGLLLVELERGADGLVSEDDGADGEGRPDHDAVENHCGGGLGRWVRKKERGARSGYISEFQRAISLNRMRFVPRGLPRRVIGAARSTRTRLAERGCFPSVGNPDPSEPNP